MDLMFPVLGMLLDLVDALATAVALVAFWRTWLFPRRLPRPAAVAEPAAPAPTGAAELDRFLSAARRYGGGGRA